MKLPAHSTGLPGKVILFYIVLLDPAYLPTGRHARWGLRGTFRSRMKWEDNRKRTPMARDTLYFDPSAVGLGN
jgi:hypothetical protein